ncbi:hypothetical protein [Amycolatopsis sp. NPDC004378]
MVEPAERIALTAFCAELPGLRGECVQQPADRGRLLDRIEEAARGRRPILSLLEQLLGAPPDEAVRSLSSGLPGAGAGHADEELFACPDGACDRLETADPAGPAPRCPLTGDRLKRR